jgi:hypothetical protein
MSSSPFIDDTMVVRWVSVPACDVVYLRSVIEASDGVAQLFAERGGELCIAAPRSRQAELDCLLADLKLELPFEAIEPRIIGADPKA